MHNFIYLESLSPDINIDSNCLEVLEQERSVEFG